jgi:hypothetical protein
MVKKALLIGINYKNTENELHGCINDVLNIQQFLTTYCLFHIQNIHVLTDETEMKPTSSNIQSQIKWLVSNNVKGDTLVFYYSGHGSNVQDYNGDETDSRDETLVPLDFQTSGLIKDDYLFTNLIYKVPKGVSLCCFSDSCHSGSIVDLKYNFKCSTSLKKGKTVSDNKYVPLDWSDNFSFSLERSKEVVGNICLLSGCRDAEFSTDAYVENKNQGAFTFCLLKILNNNLISLDDSKRFNNGTLKLRNLLKELNVRLYMNGFTDQHSQLSLSKMEDVERTLDL